MSKINCWESKNCQRHEGGSKVNELGLCPAASAEKYDGANGGKNGGRLCWRITATLCGGKVQGSLSDKIAHCALECDFFKQVRKEEAENYRKL